MEMLQTKSSINQTKNTMENISSRLNQAEERISRIENKSKDILYQTIKKKLNKHD
jgi:methyl-accepting chemotaxis protein